MEGGCYLETQHMLDEIILSQMHAALYLALSVESNHTFNWS